MRGSTLSFAPTKTDGPISVDLRDNVEFLSLPLSSLSLSRSLSLPHCQFCPKNCPFPSFCLTFLISFFFPFFSFKFGYIAYIVPCVHLSFGFVSTLKQFISFQFNLF